MEVESEIRGVGGGGMVHSYVGYRQTYLKVFKKDYKWRWNVKFGLRGRKGPFICGISPQDLEESIIITQTLQVKRG